MNFLSALGHRNCRPTLPARYMQLGVSWTCPHGYEWVVRSHTVWGGDPRRAAQRREWEPTQEMRR